MVFLAYFLVLYGGVGFIQDKRFFSFAPKENLDAIPDTKERFPGAHSIGWVIEIIAILLFLAAAALSVWDGVRNGFGFLDFFVRFLAVLYAMEIYDIIFFECRCSKICAFHKFIVYCYGYIIRVFHFLNLNKFCDCHCLLYTSDAADE